MIQIKDEMRQTRQEGGLLAQSLPLGVRFLTDDVTEVMLLCVCRLAFILSELGAMHVITTAVYKGCLVLVGKDIEVKSNLICNVTVAKILIKVRYFP